MLPTAQANTKSAIIAVDSCFGYAKDGSIPWPRNSDDLKWFASMTAGHTMVMGGKTFRSLPPTFKLRDRKLIVLTNELTNELTKLNQKIIFTNDLQSIINTNDLWVCGAYDTLMPYVNTLYINILPGDYQCTSFLNLNFTWTDEHNNIIDPLTLGPGKHKLELSYDFR